MRKCNWRKKLYSLIRPELNRLDVAHRMEHSLRVYKNCEKIASENKKINLDILYAASLLHDIGQTVKSKNEHSKQSVLLARKFLSQSEFPKNLVYRVDECIRKHDDYIWIKGHSEKRPKSSEAKVFQDADRLESIGAIGIIRQFLFSGKHNKKIYDEKISPRPDLIYGGNISGIHTVRDHEMNIYRHFNTKEAKKIAKDRHNFIKLFLKQFFKEWKQ